MFGLQGCEDWGITSDGKEKADMTTEMIERILSKENLDIRASLLTNRREVVIVADGDGGRMSKLILINIK